MGLLAPFCDIYCPQQLSILKIQVLRTVYYKKLEGFHKELYQHILSVRIVKLIEIHILDPAVDLSQEIRDTGHIVRELKKINLLI